MTQDENTPMLFKSANNSFIIFIATLSYTFLTIATITNELLLLNKSVLLPFIQLDVPFDIFMYFITILNTILYIVWKQQIWLLKSFDRQEIKSYNYNFIISIFSNKDKFFLYTILNNSINIFFLSTFILLGWKIFKLHDIFDSLFIYVICLISVYLISIWKTKADFYFVNIGAENQFVIHWKKRNLYILISFLVAAVIFYFISCSYFFNSPFIKWSKINISHTDLTKDARLKTKRLRWLDFKKANLNGANLSYSILKNVSFKNCKLRNSKFDHAKMQNANFSNCNLENASLINCNLDSSVITGGTFDGIIFNNENIDGQLLSKNIYSTRIRNAYLKNFSLENSDLSNVDFSYTIFDNVDLKNAKFNSRTNLSNSVLTKAKNLKVSQLKVLSINMLKNIILPANVEEEIKEGILKNRTNNFEGLTKDEIDMYGIICNSEYYFNKSWVDTLKFKEVYDEFKFGD